MSTMREYFSVFWPMNYNVTALAVDIGLARTSSLFSK